MPDETGRDMPMVIFEKGSPFEVPLYDGATMERPYAMISCTLDYIPLSDIELTGYVAGNNVFEIPAAYAPDYVLLSAVVLDEGTATSMVYLTIHPGGYVTLDRDVASGTLKLNGWSVNLCSTFYGKEVQNG